MPFFALPGYDASLREHHFLESTKNWTIEMPIHHFHIIFMQKMMPLLEGDLEVFHI